MNNIKKLWYKLYLPLLFSFFVFLIMLTSMLFLGGMLFALHRLELVFPNTSLTAALILLAIASLMIGSVLSVLFNRHKLTPLTKIMSATDRIADGDYSTRVYIERPDELRQLCIRFNHMVEEINSVEMLRKDFVNNFSHEFKTPIVSIRGFAKMLKREDLTQDEKNEYLDIIINESERLSTLASNVLNLSRLEKQAIVSDKEFFNVTEQIRLVIAMLDSKWTHKEIELIFDSPEIYLYSNEEMLKQVWINLLDNAYKFSPDHGIIEIQAVQDTVQSIFTFSNPADTVSEDMAAHAFDKFYQGDTSHTQVGNGLGLTIAKRIIQLHGGDICLDMSNHSNVVFCVTLPVKQAASAPMS